MGENYSCRQPFNIALSKDPIVKILCLNLLIVHLPLELGHRFIERVPTRVRKLVKVRIETGEYASLARRHVLAVRVDLRLAAVRHDLCRSSILKGRTAPDDD